MTSAPTKPSEALRAARDLLTPEGAWIQEEPAKKADGSYATYVDGDCFCALGAIWHVNGGWVTADPIEFYLMQSLGAFSVRPDIAHWNDDPNRTQAEVLDAFSRAILLAEAEGQ
jgi:hypothetical protein